MTSTTLIAAAATQVRRRSCARQNRSAGSFRDCGPYRGASRVAAVCLVVAAGVGLAFPQVVRYLLDAAFQQHDRALLDRIALGLLALFALQGVMNFVQVYLLTSTTERVIAELREDVFAHLVRLSPGFFTEHRTGELTSRLSADLARAAVAAEHVDLRDVAADRCFSSAASCC